ncbi:MAG: hypothetical protein IT368_14525 [Candidatus Hydrogenedentes bacterium]|nr:hypothetical protein [Candidatus Hydrogenedentota bacterium]
MMLSLIVIAFAAAPAAALPAPLDWPGLQHVLQISETIYSGCEPANGAAFDRLAAEGIRTVVSVDAQGPDTAAAEARGMRYVHIPIGYNSLPAAQVAAVKKVLEECPRPIYFHCHHGVHRGPAMAAIALRLEPGGTSEAATKVLERAGTSPDYPALWKAVAELDPSSVSSAGVTLHSRAPVPPFPEAMAHIDRAWDGVKACREAGWKTPADQPDLVPVREAQTLEDLLARCAAPAELAADVRFEALLAASRASAAGVAEALEAGTDPEGEFAALGLSCKDCHKVYR